MTEYEIIGRYEGKWEVLTTESNLEEATDRLREYNDNEPNTWHRIRMVNRV